MQNETLYLVAINTGKLSANERRDLWKRVIELAMDEGASWFTCDPPVSTGRLLAADQPGNPSRDTPNRIESPADLIEVGVGAVALNLYRSDGWVAGISDWGDDIDVLLPPGPWDFLKEYLGAAVSNASYDVAEAMARTPPPWNRDNALRDGIE